jgi:hypothetical protein
MRREMGDESQEQGPETMDIRYESRETETKL